MKNILIKKVKENLLNPILRNHREHISISNGELIVLGYDYREKEPHIGDRVYVFIAEFVSGDLNSVYVQNILILEHIREDNTIANDVYSMEQGEGCADAMSWWRTPTDDEIELYKKYYKSYGVIQEINTFINNYDETYTTKEDFMEMLEWIKQELKSS